MAYRSTRGHQLIVLAFFCLVTGLAVFLLSASSHAQTATTSSEGPIGTIRAMHLLDPATGWVLVGDRLLWTSSAGNSWSDITPDKQGTYSIADVFFLNQQQGWAVLVPSGLPSAPPSMYLARTFDSGVTWSTISLSDLSATVADAYGRVSSFGFLDSLHGWMMVRLSSSSNFSFGRLFTTADGGLSWNQLPTPPTAGQFVFTTPLDGWLVGGPDSRDLFSTRDGGKTWQAAVLPTPLNAIAETSRSISLPVFDNSSDGLLGITYEETTGPCAYEFRTYDGGRNWQLSPQAPICSSLFPPVLATANSTMIVATADASSLALSIGGSVHQNAPLSADAHVGQIDFVSITAGWLTIIQSSCDHAGNCAQSIALRSTLDGGTTFSDITPTPLRGIHQLRAAAADQTSRLSGQRQLQQGPILPSYSTRTDQNLGFDRCDAPSMPVMQNWLSTTPYRDANIYIGGVNASCKTQTYLSPSWVTQVSSLGWGLIPTFVGKQPFCTTCTNCSTYSDPTSATQAGTSEAVTAYYNNANLG